MRQPLRQRVHRRAGDRCEYCHLPQAGHEERFSLDHVMPRKHGGDDSLENLALSCLRCNLYKGTDLSGIDPISGKVTSIFDPRRQLWSDHFRLTGAILFGLTPTGRATVALLQMNAQERLRLREALLLEGVFKLT